MSEIIGMQFYIYLHKFMKNRVAFPCRNNKVKTSLRGISYNWYSPQITNLFYKFEDNVVKELGISD